MYREIAIYGSYLVIAGVVIGLILLLYLIFKKNNEKIDKGEDN
jgi:hypothetical protein